MDRFDWTVHSEGLCKLAPLRVPAVLCDDLDASELLRGLHGHDVVQAVEVLAHLRISCRKGRHALSVHRKQRVRAARAPVGQVQVLCLESKVQLVEVLFKTHLLLGKLVAVRVVVVVNAEVYELLADFLHNLVALFLKLFLDLGGVDF